MEGKTELCNTAMLIDFSSPVSKRLLHTPLIPVPVACTDPCNMFVSPSNTNPFDKIAKQTIYLETIENDPFECVTKTTLKTLNTTENISFDNSINNQLGESSKNDESIEQLKENVTTENFNIIEENKQNSGNKPLLEFEKGNANDNRQMIEPKSSVLLQCGEDNLSQVSVDLSSEDGIKATIAKRVNKCIQKVLSNSMINTKPEVIKTNRKSSSFTTSSCSNKMCPKLNRSCSDDLFTDNYNISTLENSICSCDNTPVSFLSKEDSQNNESRIPISEKDEIFLEANKLALTFSKIAESCSKNAGSENDEDLLLCKPQWLYAESSEDEEEKLRNDPALNIRVSFTSGKSQDQPDSDALSAFKRRSFSHLQGSFSMNESPIKRSVSIGSKLTVAPVVPAAVSTSVPVILGKADDNLIKLKKKPVGELKKGPMRAVMPVQNMAKRSLTGGVPLARTSTTSPVKKKSSSQIMISPIKDNSQLSMHPVASSTPNKPSSAIPQLWIPQSKRRSLGSTADNRKSRSPLLDSGSRQRSSSASSIIPSPTPGRTLGPKSVSNLTKTPSSATGNSYQGNDSEIKLSKPIKPNLSSKAQNGVKSKISRPSKVQSTVNAISNMFTGKSRKTLRDKENRFPA